jgi:hypothetical protein
MLPDLVLQNIYDLLDCQITKLHMETVFISIIEFQNTFSNLFNNIPKIRLYPDDNIEVHFDISQTTKMVISKNYDFMNNTLYEVKIINYSQEDNDRFIIPERFRDDFTYDLPVFLHLDYHKYNTKCRELLSMRPKYSTEFYRVSGCCHHVSVHCTVNNVYVYLPYLVKYIELSNGYKYITHNYRYSTRFPIPQYYLPVYERHIESNRNNS